MSTNGIDKPNSIDIENSIYGGVYVTGYFYGAGDIDTGPGVQNIASTGQGDIFFFKLDTAGTFLWGKTLGGIQHDSGQCVSIDHSGSGNLFVSGSFAGSIDLDPGEDTTSYTPGTIYGSYISKFNRDGHFIWSKKSDGLADYISLQIAVGTGHSVFASGATISNLVQLDDYTLTSGGGTDVFLAKLGCANSVDVNESACLFYISPSGNDTWFESGIYTDTLLNCSGCDSVITINLVIHQNSSSFQSLSGCESYISPSGNNIWTASGIYQDVIPNAVGCDSLMTIDLMIYEPTYASQTIYGCTNYISPSGNEVWSESGIYQDTIPNSHGCDSIMTLQLVLQSSYATLNMSDCNSMVSPSGNYTWQVPGIYLDTIPNSVGCDSLLTIVLELNSTNSIEFVTACNYYIPPSGNEIWTSSGIYLDTIPNSAACDSIISFHVTINSSNTNVVQNANTLNASATNATYQWLDCNDDFGPISGATAQAYSPVSNGLYAVAVTQNGCVDTSACHSITGIGITGLKLRNGITVFPNPANTNVTIASSDPMKPIHQIRVSNLQGEIVYSKIIPPNSQVTMDTTEFAVGIYAVQIWMQDGWIVEKLLVEK